MRRRINIQTLKKLNEEMKEFVSREYNIPMKCWNVLKRITDDMYDEFEESCK